ncbi:MAG: citrate transporter [Phascolarctobacterium sp.]|uniref:SLC13 family permease n=1 Tax=Phascolarctobacterium sp. TaxID=2049039 RepID=UPI0025CB9DBF|nr:SLC13 family permease [Phascolarctobacterium sp.]MCC8159319.1 citrate transporter [Phascolarctobacterium sp.]
MVKNLDTKEIWEFSKSFVRREGILVAACLLAAVSSLAAIPKAEYIDWHVLVLLYCLMLVVGGLKKRRILDHCAVRLLQKCVSLRQITAALLLVTFVSSMLVTNDVALITFVPLTLIIGREAGLDVGKIIIWQTLAANLGSMLTPMGNPQNLFLYARYNFEIITFLKVTLLPTCLAGGMLAVLLLRQQDRALKVDLAAVKVERGWDLGVLALLFLLCVAAVFHLFDHWLLLAITVTAVLVLDRGLFRQIDYSLLITFGGFFIFIGNLTQFDFLNIIRDSFLGSAAGTYFSGIAASQFISNVPAAMLLAAFTQQKEALLLGVNIGGLGTLIASMASVISYKLFAEAYPAQVRHYLLLFLYYNAIGLFLLVPSVYFLLLY